MPMTISPPLKWHGGKTYLARRIIALMPPHTHYVEPYAGGLAVLLAKNPEGVSEVVNDLDGRLTSFWRVLKQPDTFERFRRTVEAVPFSQVEWDEAAAAATFADPVDDAVAFFIHCRQSLAGRMASFAPLSRSRTRRGMNEQASAWWSAVEGLPAVHGRLARVAIFCRDALDVIRSEDGPDTLFYLDPPYLPDARTSPDIYACEMPIEAHAKLIEQIQKVKGRVILSGFRSELYDRALRRWRRVDFDMPNHAAGGSRKRRMIESIWSNRTAAGNRAGA
jgi:DNA adenine methylase